MGVKTLFFALREYFSARLNLLQSKNNITKLQKKLLQNEKKKAALYSFYNKKNIKNFDDYEIIEIKNFRDNFEKLNLYSIDFETAKLAAQASENGTKDSLKNKIKAGFSTGTSGKERGLFLTNSYERASYLGQILGKLFSIFEIFKIKKIALCLRAGNELYKAPFGTKIKFFPLSINREEIANEIIEFSPDLIIAPTQILLTLARLDANLPRLKYCFYGAEAMNFYEADYIFTCLNIKPMPLYQATEGFLGAPCKNGKLHLNEDNIYFEFEEIKDTYFRPIISDLKRQSQFIRRLKLDDILQFGACNCNSPFQVIENIGRHQDIWQLDELYIANEIELKIAPFINPANDWVVIGSKNSIEIYTENQNDFIIINSKLANLKIPIVQKKYTRDLDFPKRRHIRWRA